MASKKVNNIYLKDSFTLAGKKEAEGSVKTYDLVMNDYYYNCKTFEQAEIKMQRTVIDNLLTKTKLLNSDIDLLVGGDLSNQISVTSITSSYYNIPFLGVYSACASFVESLIIASSLLESKRKGHAICVTSAHTLHSEKQFRYPIEYGAPKPHTTTITATGAVASLLTKTPTNIKIESYTIGKSVDMGIKDAKNMGAVMAPAAAKVLMDNLLDNNRSIDYYDLILTGDLGCIGVKIFREYLKRNYNLKIKNHIDAGCELYLKSEEVYAGASGPATLPMYLFNKILANNKYKKILIIGTGSLHNPLFVNQKLSIPAIAHAVSLEVNE